MNGARRYIFGMIVLLGMGVLTACGGFTASASGGETPVKPMPTIVPTATSFLPLLGMPTSTPQSAANEIPAVWISPQLPQQFRDQLALPDGWQQIEDASAADVTFLPGGDAPVAIWTYALVVPFPTMIEEISLQTLEAFWHGEGSGPFHGKPLLMDASTEAMLRAVWGMPAVGAAQVMPSNDMALSYAWQQREAWAIVPFEELDPRWKVLSVDGQNPLHKDFSAEQYGLNFPIQITGSAVLTEQIIPTLPTSNRDSTKLTTVVLTGVTALVRATAWTMEVEGYTYPADQIGGILRSADITHISNEVSFMPHCPFPDPNQVGLVFCSDPRYIALLDAVGTDVVELTGDHFHDYGDQPLLYTLDLYDQRGWKYYGGGRNLEDARKAILIEHNGNKIAFIGCNAKGGGYATASATSPGAVACDFDWMHAEIARLRTAGYLPIVTFQHQEYYTYVAQPDQVRDFTGMAKAGAVIVSGSQAHQPQAMAFYGGTFIHYGLGNLFFDQISEFPPDTSWAFIDRHVFYDGKYLGVELIPIVFEDYALSRPMTITEAAPLYDKVFSASGW